MVFASLSPLIAHAHAHAHGSPSLRTRSMTGTPRPSRAHRIGQQRVLHVYRLFVPNSIEEKVLAGQREKLEVARAVVNDDNTR